MSEKNTIIELKDVSFAYSEGAEHALDHVDLAVREGEFVGVIGPSGAGKSTLAAVMSGAIPHHFSGQLFGVTLVDGQDTCEVTLTDISRIVGSVLQDIDSQMVASVVEDEMLFGLENFGVPHDQIEDRIQQTLATVGIADLHDREI
ncbi:ATP-binding cassette domain-containing protein, partial [Paratractidigestivibacter sp.]|uniref:ATP-binding cassette domain-containing protein n=1 Tax=Paratractidigestivibacter sp. TaxID=2847316 RepID=UPI0040294963